jgi:hypothetical protein
VFKRLPSVKRRINIDALHLTGELLLQRLQREEVVAKNEPIIKQVAVRHAVLGVMGLGVVGNEDTRLQPRPVLFPDPSEFEFGLL